MLSRSNVCVRAKQNFLCNGYDNKYYCGTPGVKPPGFNCTYECPDISQYRRYECDGENEFNPMATLTLVKGNDAIKALFTTQRIIILRCFSVLRVVLFIGRTCIRQRGAVGLFVPCLLIGGSFGRGIGELVLQWGVDANPAMYALIGASAVLSGVTRITITISVILYETTDKVYLILPIMASVLIAKWIADCFNISLYDSYIELQHAPFIESHPPERFADETAGDVMVQPAMTLLREGELSCLLDDVISKHTQRVSPLCRPTVAT